MATNQLALFPHVLKLERPFKKDKLDNFIWEAQSNATASRTKVSVPKFSGSLVEELIYCGTQALEMF